MQVKLKILQMNVGKNINKNIKKIDVKKDLFMMQYRNTVLRTLK